MKKLQYQEVVGYVIANKLYRDPYLTLKRLASQLGVGIECLSETIQDGCGKKFTDLLLELRIKEAKNLLCRFSFNGFSIEAIGRMSGFKDRINFQTNFEETTGYKPSDFQRLRAN